MASFLEETYFMQPRMAKKQLLCVYGTLRRGFLAHNKLKDGGAEFVGTTHVMGFDMVSLGKFPGSLRVHDLSHGIFVEVYEIPEQLIPELDAYEGVPAFYRRILINSVYGEAWIYILPEDDTYTSLPRINSGKWGTD